MISFGIFVGRGRTAPRQGAQAVAMIWSLLACAPRACHRAARTMAGALVWAILLASIAQGSEPSIAAGAAPSTPPRMRVLFLHVNFPDREQTRPWSDFQNPSRSGLI